MLASRFSQGTMCMIVPHDLLQLSDSSQQQTPEANHENLCDQCNP